MGRLNNGRTKKTNAKPKETTKPKATTKPKETTKPNTPLKNTNEIGDIIRDSDNLKRKIRELINIHSKKNVYSGISNIKKKLTEAVINDLMYH